MKVYQILFIEDCGGGVEEIYSHGFYMKEASAQKKLESIKGKVRNGIKSYNTTIEDEARIVEHEVNED